MTTNEAAAKLNLTPQRVWQLIDRGQLPATKVGRDWHVSEGDLAAFHARVRRPGHPAALKELRAKGLMPETAGTKIELK